MRIPCDYTHYEGGPCDKGTVLVYGEMGGRRPRTINCPSCGGSGTQEVEESFVEQKIADLIEERDELNEEIQKWQSYYEESIMNPRT